MMTTLIPNQRSGVCFDQNQYRVPPISSSFPRTAPLPQLAHVQPPPTFASLSFLPRIYLSFSTPFNFPLSLPLSDKAARHCSAGFTQRNKDTTPVYILLKTVKSAKSCQETPCRGQEQPSAKPVYFLVAHTGSGLKPLDRTDL